VDRRTGAPAGYPGTGPPGGSVDDAGHGSLSIPACL